MLPELPLKREARPRIVRRAPRSWTRRRIAVTLEVVVVVGIDLILIVALLHPAIARSVFEMMSK